MAGRWREEQVYLLKGRLLRANPDQRCGEKKPNQAFRLKEEEETSRTQRNNPRKKAPILHSTPFDLTAPKISKQQKKMGGKEVHQG